VAGWNKITDAVHAGGSRIFVQLMHAGRVGHPDNMPAGARLLGPSAVAWESQIWTDAKGMQPVPTAEAMTEADIAHAIEEFAHAAELAMHAGFDGVELHGANGYLIEQFLNTAANQRTDQWGGSVANRIRFAVEVAKRTVARIGADRVGIRLSPHSAAGGLNPNDDQVTEVYQSLAQELGKLGLAYIHIVDHTALGNPPVPQATKETIKKAFGGPVILAGGYDLDSAKADLAAGKADLVAFGRPFLVNPRLVSKFKQGLPLLQPDFNTFYTPDEKGYTDYPAEA